MVMLQECCGKAKWHPLSASLEADTGFRRSRTWGVRGGGGGVLRGPPGGERQAGLRGLRRQPGRPRGQVLVEPQAQAAQPRRVPVAAAGLQVQRRQQAAAQLLISCRG
jgi:hypothetical protein